jgi:hypothetical protein
VYAIPADRLADTAGVSGSSRNDVLFPCVQYTHVHATTGKAACPQESSPSHRIPCTIQPGGPGRHASGSRIRIRTHTQDVQWSWFRCKKRPMTRPHEWDAYSRERRKARNMQRQVTCCGMIKQTYGCNHKSYLLRPTRQNPSEEAGWGWGWLGLLIAPPRRAFWLFCYPPEKGCLPLPSLPLTYIHTHR